MQEEICDNIKENCICYYDDEDACLIKCAEEQGYDFCGQDKEFNAEEFMKCREAEFDNNNGKEYSLPAIEFDVCVKMTHIVVRRSNRRKR